MAERSGTNMTCIALAVPYCFLYASARAFSKVSIKTSLGIFFSRSSISRALKNSLLTMTVFPPEFIRI